MIARSGIFLVAGLSLSAGISLGILGEQAQEPDSPCKGELAQTVLDPEIAVEDALAALQSLRECPESLLRIQLPELLSKVEDPRLEMLVAILLADKNIQEGRDELQQTWRQATAPSRRLELAGLLARLDDPSGFPSVKQSLESEDAELRLQAIQMLPSFVPLESSEALGVLPTLLLALQDSETTNRLEALHQVVEAVKRGMAYEPLEEAVQAIAEGDDEEEVREGARRTLKLIDPENRRRLRDLRELLEQRRSTGPPGAPNGSHRK